ncbi:MAG: hypothetical protein HN576_17180 [Bacteriovoracaceae bacterium]|jgi:hypothetical protein|nr:hypothetical protein [Bacteriovoracaceae bacterium]
MLFVTKINLKRYLILIILSTATCFYFAENRQEIIGITIAMLFTTISQLALTEAVCLLTDMTSNLSEKQKKKKLIIFMILKLFFLFLGLGLGVHFMGKRVIIPVINYILQISALGVSLRTIDSES